MSQLSKIVRAARAPLFVAGMAAFALAGPPRVREIYRALAEEPHPKIWRLAFSGLLLSVSCGALASVAREILSELFVPRSPKFAVDMLPRLLAALIPGGMSVGLFLAAAEPPGMAVDVWSRIG